MYRHLDDSGHCVIAPSRNAPAQSIASIMRVGMGAERPGLTTVHETD